MDEEKMEKLREELRIYYLEKYSDECDDLKSSINEHFSYYYYLPIFFMCTAFVMFILAILIYILEL